MKRCVNTLFLNLIQFQIYKTLKFQKIMHYIKIIFEIELFLNSINNTRKLQRDSLKLNC